MRLGVKRRCPRIEGKKAYTDRKGQSAASDPERFDWIQT